MLNRNKNPQFCIITPTAYLEEYASQSQMHLVLAHLVDTDDKYADFYANRSEYKIMDNGAFELGESYSPSELIRLGQKCKANAIVLPDYPFQAGEKTVNAAEKLIPEVKAAGFDTMFVPQSRTGDWGDWMDVYSWASYSSDIDIIGMSILGLPNALPDIEKSYARVVGTAMLRQNNIFNTNKYHHYLGLNAGPALEIPSLIRLNALDSCDSSGPVWAGICGQMYTKSADSYQLTRKISKHVDFGIARTKDSYVHAAIQNNINLTLELFPKITRMQDMPP
jgi:hypothetical protein